MLWGRDRLACPDPERADIDLIDICVPGDLHAPIAIAALQAGKHVLCEKPLANTLAEARAMKEAADAAYPGGARAMVGFNYRRVPALALARTLVGQGRIGPLRHVRAVYLQDWLADPEAPMSWRMQADGPARARSATLAPTSSTSPGTSPPTRSRTCPRSPRRSSASAPSPTDPERPR